MQRMMLAIALVALAVLTVAPAAEAQVPQAWGYVHQNLNDTRYNLSLLWEGHNRESDRIWADYDRREFRRSSRRSGYYDGSYYGDSTYGGGYYSSSFLGPYGADYGPYVWGNRYQWGDPRYSLDSRYGRGGVRRGYHHQATQNNVNAWGAVNLGAQVLGTVIGEVRADKRHNQSMAAIRDSQRNQAPERNERRLPAESGPDRIEYATVYNGTGECLQVNGVVLDKGAKLSVQNPDAIQVATETGSSCRVNAEGIGNDVLLTCRK